MNVGQHFSPLWLLVFQHHTLTLFDAHEMVYVKGDTFEKVYDPHSHSSSMLIRVF